MRTRLIMISWVVKFLYRWEMSCFSQFTIQVDGRRERNKNNWRSNSLNSSDRSYIFFEGTQALAYYIRKLFSKERKIVSHRPLIVTQSFTKNNTIYTLDVDESQHKSDARGVKMLDGIARLWNILTISSY